MVSFPSRMLAAVTALAVLGSIQAVPLADDFGPLALLRDTLEVAAPAQMLLVSCDGILPWQRNLAYEGGSQIVYKYHLWTAKWWSYNDVPGGAAGVWVDNGPCE